MTEDLAPDLRRILGIQAVRAFLYGFGAVILGAILAARGASTFQVGLLGAAILAGMAIAAITVGLLGDRLGPSASCVQCIRRHIIDA